MELILCCHQKQPPKGVPRERCSENMQQIYKSCFANLLKSHFGMAAYFQNIFS